MPSRVFRPGALLACAILLCPLISLGAGTDVVHVTVASASSNKAYDLSFAPSGDDAAGHRSFVWSRSSVRSIIYIGNEQTSNTDLIAADYNGSRIVRYAGASGPANAFWTYSPTTPGPRYPEGLAADSSGNLYANRGDSGHPQVWVFKRNPVQPVAGGAFLAPVLMADSSSISGYGKVRLLDALIVPAATPGGLGAGDLLVLVNDGRVLRFPAANIGNFLAGGSVGAPITLIAAAQCPRGQTPTGMTLWPTDGSLLVATVGGAVLRYTLSSTGSTLNPAFATGLGLSLGKIRSFIKGGNPYVVFDQPLRGKIFEFGAPPSGGCASLTVACNAPLAVITTVSNPVGLAATDAATPSSACDTTVNANGCSLLGGQIVIAQNKAPAGATLLVSSCSVDADPRFNATLGACIEGSAAHPNDPHLYADDVCPGYPHTQVPSYLCGASGASGHGFTVAKVTEVGGYPTAPFDLLVSSDLTPAGSAPQCPQLTDGWAPLASEGSIVEGNQFIELAAGCDGSVGKKPGHSLDLIGMQLNDNAIWMARPSWLVDLANQKFDNLSATVAGLTTTGNSPNISAADQGTLASCVATGKSYLNDGSLPTDSRYQCAAHQAWSCDSALSAHNPILNNSNQLSLYSELQGRLENLVMHLNTRVRGQPVSATLPPPDPGLPAGGCTTAVPPPAPPTGLHYSYTGPTNLTVSWTASPTANIGGYNVYLAGVLQGSTTGTTYPIALVTTTSAALFLIEVEAFDSATPTPQLSTRASVTVTCYDPDTDQDCDAVHHDHH